jgi:hypothetical protein
MYANGSHRFSDLVTEINETVAYCNSSLLSKNGIV